MALSTDIRSGCVDANGLGPVLSALAADGNLVAGLAVHSGFDRLAELVAVRRRSDGLAELERHATDPTGTAASMLDLIRAHRRLFGTDAPPIPSLPDHVLAQLHIDGTVELVVVESPQVPDLVIERTAGEPELGPGTVAAVERAAHLVRRLGGGPDQLAHALDFEPRGVHATVLIGHPDHVRLPLAVVRRQLRQAETAAVSPLCYDELVHIARSALS